MNIREMTHVAYFAAIMGGLGFIPPIFLSFTPVPITLQTLGVLLAGGIFRRPFRSNKPNRIFVTCCYRSATSGRWARWLRRVCRTWRRIFTRMAFNSILPLATIQSRFKETASWGKSVSHQLDPSAFYLFT